MTSRSRLGKKKHGCNWKGILKIVQKAVFISISYPFSNFWFISNLYLPWYSTFCPNFSKKWSYLVHVRQGSPANYDEQRRTMTNNGEQWRTMTNNDEVMCGGDLYCQEYCSASKSSASRSLEPTRHLWFITVATDNMFDGSFWKTNLICKPNHLSAKHIEFPGLAPWIKLVVWTAGQ